MLPPSAARVAPDVYHLGTARDVDGKLVEGYAFVHPKRGDSHRPSHGGGKPGGGGSSNCFAFFADGAKGRSRSRMSWTRRIATYQAPILPTGLRRLLARGRRREGCRSLGIGIPQRS